MIKIDPKVEILYDDLIDLNVGEFLVSRDFKRMTKKLNFEDTWNTFKEHATKERRFISTHFDHDKYDSEKALTLVLNLINEDDSAKKFVFNLILNLIAFKSERTSFENLRESVDMLDFDDQYQNEILNQVNLHEMKYPEVEHIDQKPIQEMGKSEKKRIFIVHGHKEGKLNILARLLEKQGLEPIILKEQVSEGLTIIEKFEANANSDFAIIILTGDDKGNQKDLEDTNLRARQNVIFEMGYFFALLGRKNVVCIQEENIEVPSDLGGRMYIKLDNSDSWKLKLIRELRHAGFQVTADKI